jgi:hypothetical protein
MADHPCNAPDLTPIEFLEAVMNDQTFSIALRLKAAKYLTMIATREPQPSATIRIPDPMSDYYIRRFPWILETIQ